MGGMFWNCSSLTSLDLSHFDTSSVQYIHVMFRGCSSLTILDLSNFDLSSVIRKENMLLSMTSLTSLKTPNTYPSNLTIDLPKALYDVNGNEYTTLATGNPTETWLKLAYTVSFNSNGGTGTMSNQIIQYNTDTNLHTNTFTRTNYTFAGWNTRADGTGTAYLDGASVNALASANETITLYAQWAVISYTVTLDSNEGNIIDNVNLLSYETTMERNNDQYIVSGTTNTAGIYVPSEAFEGGKTYILRFKIQKVDGSLTALGGHLVHTQIYFKIDGSNSSSRYTDYYSTTNNIPNDTNVHTVELKFTYNGSTSGVDRNIYIQPNRAKTDYFKVKIFDVELEELSTTKTVNFGGTYGTLPTPTTPGYQFAGWNGKNLLDLYGRTQGLCNGSDKTSQRNFEFDKYYVGLTSNNWCYVSTIIKAELNNNSWVVETSSSGYGVGFPIKVKPNTNYYVSFANHQIIGIGFYDSSGNYISDYDYILTGFDSSRTFTTPSNCSILTIILRPNPNIESTYSNIQLEEGSTATPYEPYYVTSSTPLTRNEDHTIYAKWTPNTYSVAFNKNDNAATGNMNNQSMTYGTSSNLTNNSYYKRGYKFVGWNTASDGTGTAYLNGASVSNLTNVNNGTVTLYAQWEKLMAEDIGHTIQDLNCEDVQCVIDELYYMLY